MTEFPNPTYDDVMSGAAIRIGQVYYRRAFQVVYSQQGYSGSTSYANEDDARKAFEIALASDRQSWAKCPNGYIETTEISPTVTIVRFQSKLKNGKLGKLKGTRMLVAV